MNSTLRALLGGIVDYAGLFPPAGLDMETTVGNYYRYSQSAEGWMLGRVVVPMGAFDSFSQLSARYRGGDTWRVSALVGDDYGRQLDLIGQVNSANAGVQIDSVEVKASKADTIERISRAAPAGVRVFVEIPAHKDPAEIIRVLAATRLSAKIRTGGVTADAIPPAGDVARFVRTCFGAGGAFKATAGLHHPLGAEYALTYEADAPRARMHGFLNVFLTAAFCYNGIGATEAETLMEMTSLDDVSIGEDGISWGEYRVSTEEVRKARRRLALSFGSCSFTEPVEDLQQLNLM